MLINGKSAWEYVENGRGAVNAFVIQLTQKIDFSQMSMTMPPIPLRGLKVTQKRFSIGFLSLTEPKLGSWP